MHETSWDELDAGKYAREEEAAAALLERAPFDAGERASVAAEARRLVVAARALKRRRGVMEGFLDEFGLSNSEGLALMCLAEALLRVPDERTADELIAEKIQSGHWEEHLGQGGSWLVNAGAWGLMLTGRVVAIPDDGGQGPGAILSRIVKRAGEPVIRAALMQAMRIMGEQFVLGRTIDAAIKRGKAFVRTGDASSFSFDMLGEGARTQADADKYFAAYEAAITATGADAGERGPRGASGVSVKLTALHPRFEPRHRERALAELLPRLRLLALKAKAADVNFCLDAEEADRLTLQLNVLDALLADPDLQEWEGLGLAVQAYQKRAPAVVDHVIAQARGRRRRVMVRLVKGAYWDGEIKRAQMSGRADFPVWTTKAATDVSYLVCAQELLRAQDAIYPQFATHNAHTMAAVRFLAERESAADYEFQRLHGMGEALYQAAGYAAPVRVYAPVGGHEDLLPYLVRRLLENGANSSFVHSFLDEEVAPAEIAADPIARLEAGARRHPRVPAPPQLFGPQRRNSRGLDLSIAADRRALAEAVALLDANPIRGASLLAGPQPDSVERTVVSPADASRSVGWVREADPSSLPAAIDAAAAAQPNWNALGGGARARILRTMGDALEAEMAGFVALLAREAGRTLQDGIDEVREAVDFCRYCAAEAERLFAAPEALPGPAGESNTLMLAGRGVFAAISPWNFPLAIFTGQVAAALAAGNCVIAKPAEQTPLAAFETVKLFHAAGVPADVLQLALGAGDVGAALVADPRVAGVVFTGSTDTARKINQSLAGRDGPIGILIAETGGLNGMFVDATALKEQVVDDVLLSAFGSAGQRCSALRVLFLPHATAEATLAMLVGAMDELQLGDPADPRTDIGPVIDADARSTLGDYVANLGAGARIVARRDAGDLAGHFFGPVIVELADLATLDREIFGPVLHVVRYDPDKLDDVARALATKGYGLTLGIHSRLESFAARVRTLAPAGNVYVNRSMIGAVVGVQPFGGQGLSGTGPKAGGPHYLPRFAVERTLTINTAAIGGDPTLLSS